MDGVTEECNIHYARNLAFRGALFFVAYHQDRDKEDMRGLVLGEPAANAARHALDRLCKSPSLTPTVQDFHYSNDVRLHACKWCRDAVILQHQYEMPGSGVRYSVFDNLLIAHMGHSGRAQIIDVSGGSAPVSAAQPFAMAPIGVRCLRASVGCCKEAFD